MDDHPIQGFISSERLSNSKLKNKYNRVFHLSQEAKNYKDKKLNQVMFQFFLKSFRLK